jgi:hypothetical protein
VASPARHNFADQCISDGHEGVFLEADRSSKHCLRRETSQPEDGWYAGSSDAGKIQDVYMFYDTKHSASRANIVILHHV